MEHLEGTHLPDVPIPRRVRSSRGPSSWLGLLLGAVLLSPALAAGADPGDFKLEARTAFEPDVGRTTNWLWTVGASRFWIAPIPDWSLTVKRAEKRLELVNTNGTAVMTLTHTVLTNVPTSEDLRSIAAERHRGFQVIDEDTLNSGCGSAVVFDLLFAEKGERVRPTMAAWRTALIVNEDGLLECTLRTSVRSQQGLLRTYGRFLIGLRSPPPEEEEEGP